MSTLLLALDQADRVIGPRRGRAVLYTTLEPCLMCLGAAATTMVERVVYALGSATDQFRRFRDSRPSPIDALARWADTIIG